MHAQNSTLSIVIVELLGVPPTNHLTEDHGVSSTMPCTRLGYICFAFLVLFLGCIYVGSGFEGAAPNNELSVYYEIDGCLSDADSFQISGRGYYYTYLMRGTPSSNAQRDTACPAMPVAASNVKITLEEDDEYSAGKTYTPVLVLPRSAYAMASFSVVDASGSILLPATTISVGPDEAYPWTVESSAISYPTSATASASTPDTTSCCTDTCTFASDGACDDGGSGAQYSVCTTPGSDCSDCGSRCTGSGRRLLYSSSQGGGEFGGAWESDATSASLRPASRRPTSRRLLKGGSSGSSSYSSSYSSRSSRSSFLATSTRTSYSGAGSSSTYQSRSYGGSSSYAVGSRTYYMPSQSYSYHHASSWYSTGLSLIIISRFGYGCYSCGGAYRTCHSCSGCETRRDCSGGRDAFTLRTDFDRYELSFAFDVPVAGSPKWPLALVVSNFTLFEPRAIRTEASVRRAAAYGGAIFHSTEASAYITFATDGEDDGLRSIFSQLKTPGYLGLLAVSCFMIVRRRELFTQRRAAVRFQPKIEWTGGNQQPVGYWAQRA